MCVAYPGLVLDVTGEMALVETDHRRRRASLALVPEVVVGDHAVLHQLEGLRHRLGHVAHVPV